MNKKLLIIIGIVGLCSLPWLWPRLKTIPYLYQQKELAEFLGVDIKDYRQADFPYEYFANTLTPGMTIREVHQIMRGDDIYDSWRISIDGCAEGLLEE